jgi:hypothetical protein
MNRRFPLHMIRFALGVRVPISFWPAKLRPLLARFNAHCAQKQHPKDPHGTQVTKDPTPLINPQS